MGEGVFRAGNNLPASQDFTTSDESEPESGDKAPVTDGDDDEEEKEHGENVGVFSCENRAYTDCYDQHDTPARLGERKRSASESPAPVKSARPIKHSCKSGPDAVDNVALAVCDLANAICEPESSSPKCRSAAVQALEQDGCLTDLEQVKAIRLFQHDTTIADSYLAIKKASTRELFIHTEISGAEST
jgi:hypothetical protein